MFLFVVLPLMLLLVIAFLLLRRRRLRRRLRRFLLLFFIVVLPELMFEFDVLLFCARTRLPQLRMNASAKPRIILLFTVLLSPSSLTCDALRRPLFCIWKS